MDTSRHPIERGLLTAALLLLSLWVVWPFLPALAWAGVIAIATWPLRERLCARAGPDLAAGLLAILVTLALLGPVLVFGVQLAREAGTLAGYLHAIRENGAAVPDWLPRLPVIGAYAAAWWQEHLGDPDAAKEFLGESGLLNITHWSRDIGGQLFRRTVILMFTLLALFFIYRDGGRLVVLGGRIADRLFGPPARRYGEDSIAAIRATVSGLVLVGLGEGLLLGIAYMVAGVPHPVLLGLATGVLAIVPFGAPAVLVLAGLILLAQGQVMAAILLVALGGVLVFVADHLVRPVIIGSAIRLPFLWTLIGVFGGLEAFGIVGLFLGPAIMSIAVTIFRDAAAYAEAEEVSVADRGSVRKDAPGSRAQAEHRNIS